MCKTILKDSRVEEVEVCTDSDYKYFVYLKVNYHWSGYNTTMRGFHSVRDFTDASYSITDGKPPHGFE